jgi:hypothetical protein
MTACNLILIRGTTLHLALILDCFQLKKELEELTARMGQQTVQEIKEGSLSESSSKEEETSADKGAVLVKEETVTCANKEGAEEEAEVSRYSYFGYAIITLCLILLRSYILAFCLRCWLYRLGIVRPFI